MNGKNKTILFLREVQRIISKYGDEKALEKLRLIHEEKQPDFDKSVSEYILNITAEHFMISQNDLVYSNKRGMVSDARRMGFALLKEHLYITDEEIGDRFGGRSRQYINRELRELPINQDEFATKDESKFVNDFIHLTRMVIQFKNKQKTQK